MTRLDLRQMFTAKRRAARCFLCLALLLSWGFLLTPAQGQTPDAGPILGQITGIDISVTGPSQPATNSPVPAIEFSGGSTIVVHSGKGRIDFVGGGVLDICGPAKFTVLSSGEALTIALSFGRVRVRVDALRPIAVYSPLVVATPVPIGDRARDATVGLTNNGAMCVLASSGALRLQNQLNGETIVVPQPAEVLVPGASFTNLPAAPGQCRCEVDQASARRSIPATSTTVPPLRSASVEPPHSKQPAQAKSTPAISSAPQQAPAPRRDLVAPKNAPVTAPSPPPAAQTAPNQPALKINLPAIGYDAGGTTGTAEPLSVATLMLAQETVVERQWTFHGTVVSPGKPSHPAPSVQDVAPPSSTAPQSRRGFWAKLRAFITGSDVH